MMSRSSSGPPRLSRSEEELPLHHFDHGVGAWPRWSSKSQYIFMRSCRTRPALTLFGTVAVLGSLVYVVSSSLGYVVLPTSTSSWYHQGLSNYHITGAPSQSHALEHTGFFDVTPGGIPDHLIKYSRIELDEVSAMLAKSEGFFARDYSLHLGWNNVCVARKTVCNHIAHYCRRCATSLKLRSSRRGF